MMKKEDEQSQIADFDDQPEQELDWLELANRRQAEIYANHPTGSILIKPYDDFKKEVKKPKLDEKRAYKIDLGEVEDWNFEEYLDERVPKEERPKLRRRESYDHRFLYPFCAETDDYGVLESEHFFLSGTMGMGKTNLCSIITTEFPKRDNPTVSVWFAQKAPTATNDFPKVKERLEEIGRSSIQIRVGQQESKLPIEILQPDDIKQWFKMSDSMYTKFLSTYYSYQNTGGSMAQAINEFIEEKGERYAGIFHGLRNVFAIRKKDVMEFKPHMTYLLDISKLLKTQSSIVSDIVINAWLNYLETTIDKKRSEATQYADEPAYYKKQWQGLVVFDEYYGLTQRYSLDRTKRTINNMGTEGRQSGISLVIASQTVFGTQKEKVPLAQANIFQFLPSYTSSDMGFVLRCMGWEKNKFYENGVGDVFTNVFRSGRDANYRGKTILFEKKNRMVKTLQLRLL